jgi:hypothetical protein
MTSKLLFVLAALPVAAAGCSGASSAGETEARTTASSQPAAESAAVAPTANASAPTAAKQRPPGGLIETSFDDLKFPMEKTDAFVESMLTDRVKSLFGQRIRIRGYMYPTPRKHGLKQFVLVRDNLECCFGPGAALFDCVLVNMQEGATATYETYPIAVEGEFRFEPLPGPDGRPLALFQMVGEAAK